MQTCTASYFISKKCSFVLNRNFNYFGIFCLWFRTIPYCTAKGWKYDGIRVTHFTISHKNSLCYFICHVQIIQSEASEDTLNCKLKQQTHVSNCYDSHLTYGGKEVLRHLQRARDYRTRYSPPDFSNSSKRTEGK